MIIVNRSKYLADGWTKMEPLELSRPPELAYEYAGGREEGAVSPTRSEIEEACRVTFASKQGGSGTLTHGDIAVDAVKFR